jgi:hypothetical protein
MRSINCLRRPGLVALLTLSLIAAPALAQPSAADRVTARQLVDQGDERAEAKDYAAALKSYQAAHALMGVPTTGIEVVKVLVETGKLLEARELALSTAHLPRKANEPAVFGRAREQAEDIAQKLVPRLASLRVGVEGAPPGVPVALKIDDALIPTAAAELPRKVNPGKHRVSATAPGQTASAEVELGEGETRDLPLPLSALEGAPLLANDTEGARPSAGPMTSPSHGETDSAETQRPLLYGAFGAGALGFTVGSITGLMSLSRASSAKQGCVGNQCPAGNRDDADAAKSLGTVSNISFAVGILGAGLGVYTLLTSPSAGPKRAAAQSTSQLTPLVGADRIGLAGVF